MVKFGWKPVSIPIRHRRALFKIFNVSYWLEEHEWCEVGNLRSGSTLLSPSDPTRVLRCLRSSCNRPHHTQSTQYTNTALKPRDCASHRTTHVSGLCSSAWASLPKRHLPSLFSSRSGRCMGNVHVSLTPEQAIGVRSITCPERCSNGGNKYKESWGNCLFTPFSASSSYTVSLAPAGWPACPVGLSDSLSKGSDDLAGLVRRVLLSFGGFHYRVSFKEEFKWWGQDCAAGKGEDWKTFCFLSRSLLPHACSSPQKWCFRQRRSMSVMSHLTSLIPNFLICQEEWCVPPCLSHVAAAGSKEDNVCEAVSWVS